MAQLSSSVLAINCGSSSLKFGVYRMAAKGPELLLEGEGEEIGKDKSRFWIQQSGREKTTEALPLQDHGAAVQYMFAVLKKSSAPTPRAVGHRIVHGGTKIRDHCCLNAGVVSQLSEAADYAPLHVPPALKAIEAVTKNLGAARQVACLDVAFHHTMPEVTRTYPLPSEITQLGVERYGFHGVSLESVMSRLSPTPERVVVAHLGGGCSVTAIRQGRSVDTTMGLTPSGGMMMATRAGDLDPGLLLFLMRRGFDTPEKLEQIFDHQSGLLGVSGLSSDYRKLDELQAEKPQAKLALSMFSYQLRKWVGAMVAVLGGLDLLVLTGGIGEHNAHLIDELRAELPFLGNFEALTLASEEDLQIAKITARLTDLHPVAADD